MKKKKEMNIILTSCFLRGSEMSQHDCTDAPPFNKLRESGDLFDLMKEWHNSVVKNDLKAIIFHDTLSEEFCEKHSNNNVSFLLHEHRYRDSFNDERFFCYRNFLRKEMTDPHFPVPGSPIRNVFMTDLFDVQFHGDPFSVVDNFSDLGLCVGSEPLAGGNFGGASWINKKMSSCGYSHSGVKTAYNAGILGGPIETALKFLDLLCVQIFSRDKQVNANASCLNYLLNFKYNKRLFTGPPLHNTFGSFSPEGCLIQHK